MNHPLVLALLLLLGAIGCSAQTAMERSFITAGGLHTSGEGRSPSLLAPQIPSPQTLASQTLASQTPDTASLPDVGSAALRARSFAAARALPAGAPAAHALASARAENGRLAALRAAALAVSPVLAPLSAQWTPAGPSAIQSLHYGAISGRVTSLALDPSDLSGNTLFVGTAGGGVWESTNAAAPSAQVRFTPLTDTLPAFSPSAGSSASPSLSIGALLALPGGLVLAGTGNPNDADDAFYGTGLLRSADFGVTWSLIPGSHDGVAGNHSFFGLGFAAFAASSADPSLIVAALSQSAEGELVNAPDATNSVMGLYYSTDAGLTWHMSSIVDGSQTVLRPLPNGGNSGGVAATAVVWNAARQRFFAAVRFHGYYQSIDGITWTRLSAQPGSGLTPAACPALSASATCPILRGSLAVQPLTGDTFALTVDASNRDGGLFLDACRLSGTSCASAAPSFSQRLGSAPLQAGSASTVIPRANYNLTLAAVPVAADTLLFVGTADLFRCSLAAGCTLRNTTNTLNGCAAPAQVAPAQHAIVSGGSVAAPILFFGSDGGLWRSADTVNQQASPCSPDDATHFQNLNGSLGSLAEVVSFAQHPSDSAVLLAGIGGAGTVSVGRAGQTAWQQISAGEGGTVAINPSNPALWYLSTAAGISLANCSNGNACTAEDLSPTIGATQVAGDLALLDAPWLLDPAAPEELLVGTCRVWRGPAEAASLWSSSNRISPVLSGAQNLPCTGNNGFVRSLATGGAADRAGSHVLYAGLAGALTGGGANAGHVFSTASAASATADLPWTDLSGSPVVNDRANGSRFNPGHFAISSLTADPHDGTGNTIYATVQGFSGSGVSAPHVYRSTDAGAHWTNISANLPNAPANALAIDPNDANTLYVALDTGVYATTAVATCDTSNCWTLFGTALPNSPVTTLGAAAEVSAPDGRLGMLRAGTYGRGLWQIPLLSAATVQRPAVTLSPTALSFSSTAVATRSVSETVVVTNTGSAPLLISRVGITSSNSPTGVTDVVTDFYETDSCSGGPIAIGAGCTLSVVFAPSATGVRSSTLTINSNAPGGQTNLALSGVATAPADLQLSPLALDFGATPLAGSSLIRNVVLSNTGGTALSLSAVNLNGEDFQVVANTCGASLAASTSCTVSIVFHPAALGARTGTLSFVDALGTQTATLSGVATAPATDALSSVSLSFGAAQVGLRSSAQQLILTNVGDVPLTLIASSLAGGPSAASPDFAVTNACGNSLAPHSACALSIVFTPHGVGPANATLLLADEFRTQSIALSGTGIAPPGVSLLPANTVVFPSTGVGQTSAAQTLTLTNNGGLPLLLQSVSLTGDFALAASGGTCGVSLAPSSACAVPVVFTPGAIGSKAGSITIVDNAPSGSQTVLLSGIAIDFTLAADGPTSLTITSGKTAVFPMLFSSAAGTPGSATLSCTSAPVNASCILSPSTLPLGGATVVTATLVTGLAGAPAATAANSRARSNGLLPRAAIVLAGLLPLAVLAFRFRTARPTLLAYVLTAMLPALLLTGLAGCSSTPRQLPDAGSTGGNSASATPTPAGTYTVTIKASSGGLNRTLDLTLIVQ